MKKTGKSFCHYVIVIVVNPNHPPPNQVNERPVQSRLNLKYARVDLIKRRAGFIISLITSKKLNNKFFEEPFLTHRQLVEQFLKAQNFLPTYRASLEPIQNKKHSKVSIITSYILWAQKNMSGKIVWKVLTQVRIKTNIRTFFSDSK